MNSDGFINTMIPIYFVCLFLPVCFSSPPCSSFSSWSGKKYALFVYCVSVSLFSVSHLILHSFIIIIIIFVYLYLLFIPVYPQVIIN